MKNKIELIYGSDLTCTSEVLNKLQVAKKLLDLLEMQEVEQIKITYKQKEPACPASLID